MPPARRITTLVVPPPAPPVPPAPPPGPWGGIREPGAVRAILEELGLYHPSLPHRWSPPPPYGAPFTPSGTPPYVAPPEPGWGAFNPLWGEPDPIPSETWHMPPQTMAPPWGPEGGAPPGRLDNIPLWEAPPDPNKLLFNRINAYRQAGTGPLGSILRVAGEEVPRPLADLMMREIPVPAFVRRLAESPLGRFGGRALGFATKALTPLAVIQQGMEGFNAGTSYGSWRDRVLSGMGTEADYERLARDLNPSFAASPETYAHAAQVLVDHALSNARPGDPDNPEALGTALFLWERITEAARVAVQNAIAGAFGGR